MLERLEQLQKGLVKIQADYNVQQGAIEELSFWLHELEEGTTNPPLSFKED